MPARIKPRPKMTKNPKRLLLKIIDFLNKQIFYFNGQNDRHFYRLIPDLVSQNIYFWHLI